jgi:hypothetical protein
MMLTIIGPNCNPPKCRLSDKALCACEAFEILLAVVDFGGAGVDVAVVT